MKMNLLRFIGAETVDLPLQDVSAAGPFVLKSADGLGPPQIVVNLSRTRLEKAIYQGKSAALRQVIALVGLHPDWDTGQTPEELRGTLYGLLTPRYGKMVRMEIVHDDVVQAYAQGHLSKLETALFSKDPAVQLTLDCDYPYLLDTTQLVQMPALRAQGGGLAFDVENVGTAPSGFRMGVVLRANVGTSLVVSDADPQGQKIQIDGINWIAGDKLLIDTRPASRGVWRGAGGGSWQSVLSNLNGAVSEWMTLHKGENTLTINTTALDWDTENQFTHLPAYWGV